MGRKVFRELMSQDEANKVFYQNLPEVTLNDEEVSIINGLGRVISEEIYSSINVPPFTRAAMDGFAVIASDTTDAREDNSIELSVIGEIKAGYVFDGIVKFGQCVEISTGAPMPAGTNAVVMVEYSTRDNSVVKLNRAVAPKENTMAAGADIQIGDRIIPSYRTLTSRELAILSAIGRTKIKVVRRPKIGVFSSGDEIIAPGSELKPGKLYDINSTAIITSILENGGEPTFLGVIKDNRADIFDQLKSSLTDYDLLIISGGTSAGMGDMLYEVIDELGSPGLLVHGIKVKPGKPTILAVCDSTPVIGLPGYPASALSIHQLFVIPLIRRLARLPPTETTTIIKAKITRKLRSVEGRYEFKPMFLFKDIDEWIAYPVPGGSGAITSVALADGFARIPENTHFIPSGSYIELHLISDRIKPPYIQISGEFDHTLAKLQNLYETKHPQFPIRYISRNSTKGLSDLKNNYSHIACISLLDKDRGYNTWITEAMEAIIVPGYYRMVGLIVKKGNPKEIYGLKDLLRDDINFVNQEIGSSTRILFDILCKKANINPKNIDGYDNIVRSHSSSTKLVRQGDIDVCIGLEVLISSDDLDFVELREEEVDFAINSKYIEEETIIKFVDLVQSDEFKAQIKNLPGIRIKNLDK